MCVCVCVCEPKEKPMRTLHCERWELTSSREPPSCDGLRMIGLPALSRSQTFLTVGSTTAICKEGTAVCERRELTIPCSEVNKGLRGCERGLQTWPSRSPLSFWGPFDTYSDSNHHAQSVGNPVACHTSAHLPPTRPRTTTHGLCTHSPVL
jgi:hypothetical protein